MRVLWTHNFNPGNPVSGVFMHQAYGRMRDCGIDVQLQYLGDLRRVVDLLDAIKRVRSIANGFDIVHSQYGSAAGLVTASVHGPKLALTLRGNDWTRAYSDSLKYKAHSWLAWSFTRTSVRRYDLILAVSERMRREITGVVPGIRVETLPSPIDLDRFRPVDQRRARLSLGLAADSPLILFTAADARDANKRLGLAQEAVAQLRMVRPGAQLLVATGISPDEMPIWVAASDVLLCTSVSEGWPNSVKEALACNVPFVATDVSDLEIIARSDAHCRVVQDSPTALADALNEVLALPRPTQLNQHLRHMSADFVTERLVTFYRELLD